MNDQYSPMSSQQEFDEMNREEELALEFEKLMNNEKQKTQTKKQDSFEDE